MPYTLINYPADNKEEKRQAFNTRFSPRTHQYPTQRVLMDCPLATDLGMEQLLATSTGLLKTHRNATKFVAIGRTPLRILQAASLQDEGQGKQFAYAAFSGRFLSLNMRVSPPQPQISAEAPTEAQLNAYRMYLNSIGLHPIYIIQSYTAKSPLVIVEAITSGGGLFSFTTILHNWTIELMGKDAASQLRKCVHLHVLIDDTAPRHPNCMIHPEAVIFGGFPLTQQSVANNVLGYLFESAEVFNDSLGKPYPVKDWAENNAPPPMGVDVSPEADLLSFRIIDYMASYNLIPQLRSASGAAVLTTHHHYMNPPPLPALEEVEDDAQQNCCQWLGNQIARVFKF